MSTKTVKVTNGKVLNYKITAPGYKTMYGSQFIDGDITIQKNMVADISTDGVYSPGDRIGDCATFACYFNSTDPETHLEQRYAVFVLDAKYRTANIWPCAANWTGGFPRYSSVNDVLNAPYSATYTTTSIYSNYTTQSDAPIYYYARNAATIRVNGVPYQSQLPNVYELDKIYKNRVVIDQVDPTLDLYPVNSLLTWNIGSNSQSLIYTCNFDYEGNYNHYPWYVNSGGGIGAFSYTYGNDRVRGGVAPVFEIPVN